MRMKRIIGEAQALLNEKAKEKRYGEPNYEYVIYSWRNGGEDRNEYHVNFPDKFITDFVFGVNPSGNLVGGGFYSEKGTASIKGTFFLSIDAETRQVTGKGIKQFDTDFLELFMSEGKAAKGRELYEYDLRNLVFTEDGGVRLIAEQFYVVVYTYRGPNGQTTTTYHYYYNDIIVVGFTNEGEVEWITKIPKFQHTVNDQGYFSSFTLATNNDKFYIIYNDHPDNLNVKEKGRLKNYLGKESVTVMVSISQDGEWKKSIVFDNKEEEIYSRPKVMQQFESNGDIIVYGEKRKTYRFGALRF